METEGYENEGSPWGNSSPSADEDKKLNHKTEKKNNVLPLWGNERTMNLNPLILTNIQSSHYFKVNLYELKTYHEVIDEIYYKVTHLEPWEKGSRKTAGQTGMCGGVRGVGAGGIVSTAYCLLYKLFTLKLTRKQVNGLLCHPDSPYIRGLGFMYIRYTQPPADLWDWYDPYLDDPEARLKYLEMDVKAGGGQVMTIGDMLRAFLTKLEWFSTLFPRIPVPIQQKLEKKMSERFPPQPSAPLKQIKPAPNDRISTGGVKEARHIPDDEMSFGEAEKFARSRRNNRKRSHSLERSKPSSRDRDRERDRDRDRDRERERDRERGRDRERERDREKRDRREREKRHDGSREKHSRERERDRSSHRSKESYRRQDDYGDDLRREKDRQRRDKEKDKRHKHRS